MNHIDILNKTFQTYKNQKINNAKNSQKSLHFKAKPKSRTSALKKAVF